MEQDNKSSAKHIIKRMKENVECDPSWPRVNAYVCANCGHITFTVDTVEGTTPAMIACESGSGCKGAMQSAFYSVKPIDYEGEIITHEWLLPSIQMWRRVLKFDRHTAIHVANGGLVLYRKRSNGPVLCHGGHYITEIGGSVVEDSVIRSGMGHVRELRAECALFLAKAKKKMQIKDADNQRRIAKAKEAKKRKKRMRR